MAESWEKLKHILNLILKWVPKEIKAECEKLLPLEMRFLTLGEKMGFYSLFEKLDGYLPKEDKELIGELSVAIDRLSK